VGPGTLLHSRQKPPRALGSSAGPFTGRETGAFPRPEGAGQRIGAGAARTTTFVAPSGPPAARTGRAQRGPRTTPGPAVRMGPFRPAWCGGRGGRAVGPGPGGGRVRVLYWFPGRLPRGARLRLGRRAPKKPFGRASAGGGYGGAGARPRGRAPKLYRLAGPAIRRWGDVFSQKREGHQTGQGGGGGGGPFTVGAAKGAGRKSSSPQGPPKVLCTSMLGFFAGGWGAPRGPGPRLGGGGPGPSVRRRNFMRFAPAKGRGAGATPFGVVPPRVWSEP